MHIALHFEEDLEEYATPFNSNVLPGENKHRHLKKLAEQTNHQNPEKHLLLNECLQRGTQLWMEGAYAIDDPDGTEMARKVARTCPSLIRSRYGVAIPDDPSKTGSNSRKKKSILGQSENPAETPFHSNIRAWSPNYQDHFGIPNQLSLLRMKSSFLDLLRHSYNADYSIPHIVDPGPGYLRWYNKITFQYRDKTSTTTLSTNQFAKFQNGSFVLILNFFTHKLLGGKLRAFLYGHPVRPVVGPGATDPDLGLPRYILVQDQFIVVGLPAITDERPYFTRAAKITNIQGQQIGDKEPGHVLVYCTWEISFF
ncbi:hypothetical protein N7532_001960 [Penicillium argentinense]|uniref:Uncharacterized protein n=1 Tax=Penicillium argentinense TaxID=1131581 RepID=A0A9W9G4D9_9EURO|nr:uncharacterized protein N7532_001960 [Penicillium argentinense]KAJ5111425.1 hypothetical protein N7532_001960 [Penicillium argentinense]